MRKYTLDFVLRHPYQAVPQVQSVLGKLELCRTAALGGRTWECPRCEHRCQMYNSCADRHCPQCSGARRADWLGKTAELLLGEIDYFQVVFTLPDELSQLAMAHRKEIFALLLRTAWTALTNVLRKEYQLQPAAQMVLHT